MSLPATLDQRIAFAKQWRKFASHRGLHLQLVESFGETIRAGLADDQIRRALSLQQLVGAPAEDPYPVEGFIFNTPFGDFEIKPGEATLRGATARRTTRRADARNYLVAPRHVMPFTQVFDGEIQLIAPPGHLPRESQKPSQSSSGVQSPPEMQLQSVSETSDEQNRPFLEPENTANPAPSESTRLTGNTSGARNLPGSHFQSTSEQAQPTVVAPAVNEPDPMNIDLAHSRHKGKERAITAEDASTAPPSTLAAAPESSFSSLAFHLALETFISGNRMAALSANCSHHGHQQAALPPVPHNVEAIDVDVEQVAAKTVRQDSRADDPNLPPLFEDLLNTPEEEGLPNYGMVFASFQQASKAHSATLAKRMHEESQPASGPAKDLDSLRDLPPGVRSPIVKA